MSTAGGAATAGGVNYQSRVGAWLAVQIMAEKSVSPPWDLSEHVSFEWLRCETEQPVDDLMVGTCDGGVVFIQAKRTVTLSKDFKSELSSVIDQFVRQYLANRNRSARGNPWEKALDVDKDRLVLVTSPSSSAPVRKNLRLVLEKIRRLLPTQRLSAASSNAEEKRALSILKDHVSRCWKINTGSSIKVDELTQLLRLIFVTELDVEGGADEQQAKSTLRSAVLRNPNDADTAWSTLVSLCVDLASSRSGCNRADLQKALLKKSIEIQIIRSFREDIERIRDYSTQTSHALRHLSEIHIGTDLVKVERASSEALRDMTKNRSVLVVGDPGAGKSGALIDLADFLSEAEKDFVFLAVDRLAASSLSEARSEIGLQHDIVSVLDNWVGHDPAYLLIDALDAARGDLASTMIRELIRLVIQKRSRWIVVASIRKFDLRYGVDLRRLFSGEPSKDFSDPEFQSECHLNVPVLSDKELQEISQQSKKLKVLIDDAPCELYELLKIPFNLRLLSEMLYWGASAAELNPIRTQLELLEQYWAARIIRTDGLGDAREGILRQLCNLMVERRLLQADRASVLDSTGSQSQMLNQLLSSNVLSEWSPTVSGLPDRYILTFSHHVLFDFAVARLLFRGAGSQMAKRLCDDPELSLAVRPSLLYHFRYVWTIDGTREQFWKLALEVIRSDEIPEIGKLIAPIVAAELSNSVLDLAPLTKALQDQDSAKQTAAESLFHHLVGALLTRVADEDRLIGDNGGPWCEFLDEVTKEVRPGIVFDAQSIVSMICDSIDTLTKEQLNTIGGASRRLLRYGWSREPRESWLIIRALTCVCKTFESDPVDSAALVKKCLEVEHLARFGFEELPWLAREVKRLVAIAPELVEEIYTAAFNYEEISEEQTRMGSSRILPLVSNKRQDYEMAHYELEQAFPAFLEIAPISATKGLISVIDAYVAKRHPTNAERDPLEFFDFNGTNARFETDLSAIWDSNDTYSHHSALKMLTYFQEFLENLCRDNGDIKLADDLIREVVLHSRYAIFWRRLLFSALKVNTLVELIKPLLWAPPVLIGIDTSSIAGDILAKAFGNFPKSARERIERAILDIPNVLGQDLTEAALETRNRLLGCISIDHMISDEAKSILKEIQKDNCVPPNRPPVIFEDFSEEFSEEEYLVRRGVPLEEEQSRAVSEALRPIGRFADEYLNSTPTLDESMELSDQLEYVLHQLEEGTMHVSLVEYGWGRLAAACSRIARNEDLTRDTSLGSLVLKVLLESSQHVEPKPNPEFDAQFDEHPHWGGVKPRTESAEGLVVLSRNPSFAEPSLFERIELLTKDPVPAVRFQVASRLNALYKTNAPLMWELLQQLSEHEMSRGVLQGVLGGPFQRLISGHDERVVALVQVIFGRVIDGSGAKEVREYCVRLMTDAYIWRNQTKSKQVVLSIAADPKTHRSEASHLLASLRQPLTHGELDQVGQQQDEIRRRAIELYNLLLLRTMEQFRELEEKYSVTVEGKPSVETEDSLRSLANLIDYMAREIYTVSGAFNKHRNNRQEIKVPERGGVEDRFYRECSEIIDLLGDAGMPSVAHSLLKTLEYFVPLDPSGVFRRIGRIVLAGRKGGFQYESMAVELIVSLVERYLAEYRSILRDDDECRSYLIQMLDVFVKVGWPAARKITYRLEEIFR